MRSDQLGLGVLALLLSTAAGPLAAEEVRIYSPDGAVEMFGELLEVRENELVIQSAVGPMTVDRSKVLCEGAACPTDEPAEAATKVVHIRSIDGAVDMMAELLDVRETELVVRTAVGPMALDRSKIICEGPACPEEVPAEPETMVVRVTSADGTIEMVGELLEVRPTELVVQTAVGPMTVDRARVACDGPACPEVEAVDADFVLAGAEELGRDLMPGVLSAYAASLGGTLSGPATVSPTAAQYSVMSGSGDRLFTVELRSNDSSAGMQALIDGDAQAAMSLRAATSDEISELAGQKRGDLRSLSQEYIIGVDSLVLVVSPRLPLEALSLDQIGNIYSGAVTNWSEVGGPDVPITALAREDGSAPRELFDAFIFGGQDRLTPSAIVLDSARDVASWVASEPDSIGYVSVDNIRAAKPIDLILNCGLEVSTSPFQTKAEEYSLGRRIRLYTDNAPKNEYLQGLLDFAISAEADAAFEAAGYVGSGIDVDGEALRTRMDHPDRDSDPVEMASMAQQLNGASRLSMTFRFEAGSPRLDNKALGDMRRLVDFLAQPENSGREVIFAGFADALGASGFNTTLSRDRAFAVLDQFRAMAGGRLGGIELSATGFGEIAPVDCNDTVQGRSTNRRVEVWIR